LITSNEEQHLTTCNTYTNRFAMSGTIYPCTYNHWRDCFCRIWEAPNLCGSGKEGTCLECCTFGDVTECRLQGSMLWSQFSAIFANFRRKNWRFSQKPMLWSQFLQKLAVVWAKNANIFANFFVKNIFKNHNIGPRTDDLSSKFSLGSVVLCSI
jgi:hypothetical protein